MKNEIKQIFDKLNIDPKFFNELENATIEKVLVYDNIGKIKLIMKNSTNISPELYSLMTSSLKTFFGGKDIYLYMNVDKVNNDYFRQYFDEAVDIIKKKNPIIEIFSNRLVNQNEKYYVEVINRAEERQVNIFINDLNKIMAMYGYDLNIKTVLNEEKRNDIVENIKKNLEVDYSSLTPPPKEESEEPKKKVKHEKKIVDDNTIKGRVISDEASFIKLLDKEEENVTVEGYIFGNETFEPASKAFKIITLKVTDYTDSITCKLFTREEDEYLDIVKKTKPGTWVKLRGSVKIDKYANGELVFNIRDINKIDHEEEKRKDTYPRKRIELHAHTKMSDMDGVCDEVALVRQAMSWNHPGIAITDHDCCQAFPHVFGEVTKYNKELNAPLKEAKKQVKALEDEINNLEKKKENDALEDINYEETLKDLNLKHEEALLKLHEEEEKKKQHPNFKALYGTELEMSENYLNVVFNSRDEELDNATFVVFDVETTGFNAGLNDSIIEVGAVKVKNGIVQEERFDELINPGHHIDPVITNLTGISDYKVRDADNEENVVKRFKEFIGDGILVAHNARFDKSMLDMAYYKYQLGELSNPIVDTMMLSRIINPDLKRHSLSALTKFYKIDMDEADDEDDEESETVVEESDSFNNDYNGIKKITVNGKTAYDKEESKVYQVEFEEETEVEVEVEYINDSISPITGYGSRKLQIKPGKNYVELKYVENEEEKDITIVVNKVRSHHRADYDAEKTAEMFVKMLGQLKDLENLQELASVDYLAQKTNLQLNPLETQYDNIPTKSVAEKVINEQCNAVHVNILAKNKIGLKNLFKIISYSNTGFLVKAARIPRRVIDENREGLLIGSGCCNGEIFNLALTRCDEDVIEAMKWYDYIEVQPPENYTHLLRGRDINNLDDIHQVIKKIIDCAHRADRPIVATGDVHNIDREDRIYREIIVNQNSPAKGRHPLARFLSRKKKNSNNDDLLDSLRQISINEYGDALSPVEEKVLKIIFSLSEYQDIPMTRNNILEMYQPDKDEEMFRKSKTGEEKRDAIFAALRKFESRGFIKARFKESIGQEVYVLKYDLNPSGEEEEPHIPNQFFRTTNEMMDEFYFLDDATKEEIIIDNPQKILDMAEEIEVIEYPEVPFSPIIENSAKTVTDMVYDKATSLYGNPLPHHIEERISKELYGDCVLNSLEDKLKEENPDMDEKEFEELLYENLNSVIREGFDKVKEIVRENIAKGLKKDIENGKELTITDDGVEKELKKRLGGVIGGGFDVIYLIAQKLVKHSNDDGYLVGSRGSVGSSFVATMMGITEVNPLPAHYACPKCKHSIFDDEDGNPLGATYSSGFDLPDMICPKCGTPMNKNGQDMPFATFLGFNADKVPDIDLNFSGDNQANAHEYTKELFGTDNVYRAGTIGTVADKTAYGYVQGFEEDKEYDRLKNEMNSYGIKPPSKDELKKNNLIKSRMRGCEVERISNGCIGVKRTTGQHPGGIVVVPSYRDVFDFTPFQYPANDVTVPWRTTHFDYHAIDQDLLKLDILGHDDPTVLRLLQDLSKKEIEKGKNKEDYPIAENGEVDVTCVPLDDKATMSIFSSPTALGVTEEQILCPTGTLGIPEFGTKFVIQMLVDTKPSTFAELIKISGLSHGTDVWLGNAQDLIVNKVVPFKEVIGCRDDIMVYLSYHGVAPLKAFKIMEFVRKGKASKSPDEWQSWKQIMIDANIEPWFIDSCQKIKYMFPKAHAAAYVTSAFRIAWYKVHHPLLYYCAYMSIRCDSFDIDAMVRGYDAIKNKMLEIDEKGNSASNKEKDTYGVLQVCLEAAARGIKFKNVDINKSHGKYFLIDDEEENTLIMPFRALDGLGDNVATALVEEREKRPFMSIEDLQKRGHVSKTIIEKMQAMGVLDDMGESNQLSLF